MKRSLPLTALLLGCSVVCSSQQVRQHSEDTTPSSATTLTLSQGVSSNWVVGSSGGTIGIPSCITTQGTLVDCRTLLPPRPKRTGPPVSLRRVKASGKPVRETLAPAAYLTLARSIKLDSAATDEIRITDAIRTLEMTVYDAHLVDEYLADKASAINPWARWCWKPMRESDSTALSGVGATATAICNSVYAQRVPAPTLAKVRDFLEAIPDAVMLISDYEVKKPDPFLAVTTKRLLQEGKVWIIDCWDEPGFGVVPDMQIRRLSDSTD